MSLSKDELELINQLRKYSDLFRDMSEGVTKVVKLYENHLEKVNNGVIPIDIYRLLENFNLPTGSQAIKGEKGEYVIIMNGRTYHRPEFSSKMSEVVLNEKFIEINTKIFEHI
jgi:hypothetical protein